MKGGEKSREEKTGVDAMHDSQMNFKTFKTFWAFSLMY
jgi:hypothetical protein